MELNKNFDTPYHTKFFDVITIPPAIPQVEDSVSNLQGCNSIMFYEDAILNAIDELKDGHNGSTVSSMKKHVKAHFFQENLKADETPSDAASTYWRDNLFVHALKSLVSMQSITHTTCIKNGSALYKYSSSYKEHRAKELKLRLERFEKYKYLRHKKKKELSKRKDFLAGKPALRKGHLVENKTISIVDGSQRSTMDLELEKQREKRFMLPRQLELHADKLPGSTRKSLRQNFKIPHTHLLVKEVIPNQSRNA
eukprot:313471_1